ncbi:hypothetical protein GJR96_11055 [Haloferax sp. MBLA0076]|uniref:Uncharacterized protein n=1 Tax=Haloferax litoreum TaxID=2666140 RepID=A0A6A8GIA2_9EURY|nr:MULTISPECIES: hypothetical protein [Haloferax]MRX22491.1 hypothetical protein [Haloferax litoreum]
MEKIRTTRTPLDVRTIYFDGERHSTMNATDQFMLAVSLLIFALLVIGGLLAYL